MMNTILEQVVQLPKKEKLELYYALQGDLDKDIAGEEFSKEEWEEITKRYQDIDNDKSQFMSGSEFAEKLDTLNHELRNKRS